MKTHALREEPRVERHDRGDPDVLARVEEPRDHLDAPAALEQVVGGREALLGVDVVHDDHALADLGAAEEDVAVGDDVLAVEPGERRARAGWEPVATITTSGASASTASTSASVDSRTVDALSCSTWRTRKRTIPA